MKKQKINCSFCNKEFYRYPSLIKKKYNYCNRKCLGEHRKIILVGENNPFFGKRHTEETKVLFKNKKQFIRTKEYRDKISKISKERKCGGNVAYPSWLKNFGKEEADRRLQDLKKKRSINSSGKNNPMFGKPSPVGSGNGIGGWYKGYYVRSLRELTYIINVLEKDNKQWKSAEIKDLGIKYIKNNKKYTYFADFLVDNTILVEIKPKRLQKLSNNILKTKAAKKFCKNRGWKYIITDIDILDNTILLKLISDNIFIPNKTSINKIKKYGEQKKHK
jgi:hypothetical protein